MLIYISNICWMICLMCLIHIEFDKTICATYVQYKNDYIYFQYIFIQCHNILQHMLDGSSYVSNTC